MGRRGVFVLVHSVATDLVSVVHGLLALLERNFLSSMKFEVWAHEIDCMVFTYMMHRTLCMRPVKYAC